MLNILGRIANVSSGRAGAGGLGRYMLGGGRRGPIASSANAVVSSMASTVAPTQESASGLLSSIRNKLGNYRGKAGSSLSGSPDSFWGHATRGALIGAGTGAVTGFVNGGFGGIMGGALTGALWGGGLSGAASFAGGKNGRAWGDRLGVTNSRVVTQGRAGAQGYRGFASRGVGGSIGFQRNLPAMNRRIGGYINNKRAGFGYAGSRGSLYLNARLSTIGGVAGGLIGGNGQNKSHSTLASNGWSMGTAGSGYFY